jgi:hypothetical protein
MSDCLETLFQSHASTSMSLQSCRARVFLCFTVARDCPITTCSGKLEVEHEPYPFQTSSPSTSVSVTGTRSVITAACSLTPFLLQGLGHQAVSSSSGQFGITSGCIQQLPIDSLIEAHRPDCRKGPPPRAELRFLQHATFRCHSDARWHTKSLRETCALRGA